MRARWVTGAVWVCLLSAAACSGEDDDRPGRTGVGGSSGTSGQGGGNTGGSAGSSGAGGDASGGTAGGDSGGTAGTGGSPEGGVDAPPSVCGNGVAESDEACDGTDLDEQSCSTVGFETGTLACDSCNFDTRACTGTERCTDGRDNDGDRKNDCFDDDCAAECNDACSAPVVLSDPAEAVTGVTNGHASAIAPSCVTAAESGREVVYRITAARTGVLEAVLTSRGADFDLSARRTCSSSGTELACVERAAGVDGTERLHIAVTEGDSLFIVVDGNGAAESGAYFLSVRSRAVVCGDANRDLAEECDDGNIGSGDGCSATCQLETNESEPNGAAGQADPYTGFPFLAAISPGNDVDWFSVTLEAPNTKLTAETFDLGDGACSKELMDTLVEILASDGTRVIEFDDDGGSGFCSTVTAEGLTPGTYYVRVRGVSGSAFPYVLNVAPAL
jgi:cysteine-rich repeat protein